MANAVARIALTWAKLIIGRSVYKSYSQSGEDAVVRALLGDIRRGVYVDIGAYDPVLYSNTYQFYKKGWSGVVVDANESLGLLFRVLRPRDSFVHTAVGRTNELTYFRFKDGAYNSLDVGQIDTLARNHGLQPVRQYKVTVRTLADIVQSAGLTRIDFLSVDVEGMDEEVLSSYDWAVRPRVVAVEDTKFDPDHPADSSIYRYMRAQGYEMAGYAGVSVLFRDSWRHLSSAASSIR